MNKSSERESDIYFKDPYAYEKYYIKVKNALFPIKSIHTIIIREIIIFQDKQRVTCRALYCF